MYAMNTHFHTGPFGMSGALSGNKKLTKSKGYDLNCQLSSELIRKMTLAAKICIFKTPTSFQEGYLS